MKEINNKENAKINELQSNKSSKSFAYLNATLLLIMRADAIINTPEDCATTNIAACHCTAIECFTT